MRSGAPHQHVCPGDGGGARRHCDGAEQLARAREVYLCPENQRDAGEADEEREDANTCDRFIAQQDVREQHAEDRRGCLQNRCEPGRDVLRTPVNEDVVDAEQQEACEGDEPQVGGRVWERLPARDRDAAEHE